VPPVVIEPAIPARERTRIHALDCAATGTGIIIIIIIIIIIRTGIAQSV
jgi:hypothetical protein